MRTKQYEVKLIYHIAILALLCDMSSIQLKGDDEVKSLGIDRESYMKLARDVKKRSGELKMIFIFFLLLLF